MDLEIFRGVVAFVAVAEALSFRKAALELRVSPAAVSKAVMALEKSTGVKLFVRGPSAVALTADGELFLAHCRPAVQAVESGRAGLESRRKQPQGQLVLSAPFVASALVMPAIALLRDRHPRLRFVLRFTDRVVQLGDAGVEVAIRIGARGDSSLVSRKIRETRLVTVAAPQYLARAGTPKTVGDLDGHACVGSFGPNGKPFAWLFASGARPVESGLVVDHGPTLVEAALAGLGITQLFDFMATPLVREGKLVRILDDEISRGPDVHAVCGPGRQTSARVRAAFDAFVEAF